MLELADTAGLRDSDDDVEREGIRRARGELLGADVAVLVTDAHNADADLALITALPGTVERIVLVNKIDRHDDQPRSEHRDGVYWLWASAKTGLGLDALRDDAPPEEAFPTPAPVISITKDTHAGPSVQGARARTGPVTDRVHCRNLRLRHSAAQPGAIFGSFCIGK
ncbi:MAG: hypothetical protein WDW36_006582 [Sanguina aurantia]